MCNAPPDNTGACRVAIIADDLTGACDSAVEFLACSKSVFVLVESTFRPPPEAQDGLVVYNTQSRNLPPPEAYQKTLAATRRAVASGPDVIFKKVDSALRGNFGVEIAAVMDAASAPLAFILPAIPEARRETVGGVQHINGVPIARGFYARDPEHPVVESSVLRRAEEASNRKACLVCLDDLRARKVAATVERLRCLGCQLIVFDARTADDLHSAVEAVVRWTPRAVFVGCQGLAQALAAHYRALRTLPASIRAKPGPTLFIYGTLHPQSKRQLHLAAQSGKIVSLEIEMSRVRPSSDSNAALEELLRSCSNILLGGKDVALSLRGDAAQVSPDSRGSILSFLSELSRRVLAAATARAVVLTGGETAFAVCRALDVHALKLRARIAPLVVASEATGGPYRGLIIVTKGGSVGPDDLVFKIQESFQDEN